MLIRLKRKQPWRIVATARNFAPVRTNLQRCLVALWSTAPDQRLTRPRSGLVASVQTGVVFPSRELLLQEIKSSGVAALPYSGPGDSIVGSRAYQTCRSRVQHAQHDAGWCERR